jgi:hypothetical protein
VRVALYPKRLAPLGTRGGEQRRRGDTDQIEATESGATPSKRQRPDPNSRTTSRRDDGDLCL